MFMCYNSEVGIGKALRIVDANTVVIQNDKGKQETVRLAGIDAPERDHLQPWSSKSCREEKCQTLHPWRPEKVVRTQGAK